MSCTNLRQQILQEQKPDVSYLGTLGSGDFFDHGSMNEFPGIIIGDMSYYVG